MKNELTMQNDSSNSEYSENSKYTFDNFVVGPSNKFAYAAAKAIASNPISKQETDVANYNPLVIYGVTSLGKTHLLKAIKNEMSEKYPDLAVILINAEEFANEYITALINKTVNEFQEKYRFIDVFLVDDIQFFAGKTRTQEEFFYTFNVLVGRGKQIVLTSTLHPNEIEALDDRLCSRLVSGLVIEIQAPETETRYSIILEKAKALNLTLDDDAVEFIANKYKMNISQINGTIKRIYASNALMCQQLAFSVDKNTVEKILYHSKPIPLKRVVDEVSRATGVSVEDIYSQKRTKAVFAAKKLCFYLISTVTEVSVEEIGEEFKRSIETVLDNIKNVKNELNESQLLNLLVTNIIKNTNYELF